MTYDEIIAEVPVAAYARNADLIAEMPNVLARAETYVALRLDHDAFRAPFVAVTVGVSGLIALPADTLEVRAVRIRAANGPGFTPLRRRDEEMLHALFATAPNGRPVYYAETEDDDGAAALRVFPTPTRDYEGRLVLNRRAPALAADNQTNLLTDEYPEVLRAAVLREAAIYMGDDVLIQTYTNEFADVVGAANVALARRRRDEVTQRPMETVNVKGA